METREHTILGNMLRILNDTQNPYLRIDEKGVLHITLQRFSEDNLPIPLNLEMTTGEIIAMAGDYFTQADWSMELYMPSHAQFKRLMNKGSSLMEHLIKKPIKAREEDALILAYNNLASPHVTREQINRIYAIENNNYFPFSPAMNQYAQQLMYYVYVDNYGEMLDKNRTHFTPWSTRVYALGHTVALECAKLSYEFSVLKDNLEYASDKPELLKLLSVIRQREGALSVEILTDLMHRFHAQALALECFTFHYYTDHFSAGHMSIVGNLRVELAERFGALGGILVNNLHNELNKVGVYTKRAFNLESDGSDFAISAYGDGDFDEPHNYFNKVSCVKGMMDSLSDITAVLKGGKSPEPSSFAGFKELPDVDYDYRQYQPLIVLRGNTIFHRKSLLSTKLLSPTEYEALRANPRDFGYVKIKSRWDALVLVIKLRAQDFFHNLKMVIPTPKELLFIEADEKQRKPNRVNMPLVPIDNAIEEGLVSKAWQKPASQLAIKQGFVRDGFWSSAPLKEVDPLVEVENTRFEII